MENLKTEVTKGFEIIPKNIIKSKHSYICRTDNGKKVIQKVNASENSIICADFVKKQLIEKGYPIFDNYYFSVQGTPFFEYENEKYIMMDFIEFTDSDFSNNDDVKKVIQATALFHKLSKEIHTEVEAKTNILNIYKKQLANFKNIKKNISSKSSFSELDVIFIKNYDYFFKKAVNALDTLEELLDNSQYEENFKALCHNNIKEETAVKNKFKTSIICFENISEGLFISDFSDIINRYIRKHSEPALNFNTILENYININPLTDKEIEILQAILKFPAKYIKICCDFYAKGMPFVPNSVVNHLKCIISQKKIYENYTKII